MSLDGLLDTGPPDLPGSNSQLWEGVALESATSQDQRIMVKIKEADGGLQEYGPCPFNPRVFGYPQKGDRCLVAYDESRDPWIVSWEGDDGIPALKPWEGLFWDGSKWLALTALAAIADGSITEAKLATKPVRGEVTATGTVSRGSGFSAARSNVGRYTVTFTTAFAALPAVVVTASSAGPHSPTLTSISAGAFSVAMVVTSSTAFVDAHFNFIAYPV